ncbi:MAG: cytochrome c3 family protein [Chloroflexi bacterium]|nr:cytochrome c3 family protein [Chloroflexota bacterium]
MRRLAGLSLRQRLMLGGAAAGFGIVLVAILLLVLTSTTDAADEQPIKFSHQAHAKNDISCQFCHVGVTHGPVAGIPSVEKCMGCHSHIATANEEIEKLTQYWEKQEPIPWVRVNRQPSYVYFNHYSHVAAGVGCGSCHGDVKTMTIAEPVVEMNMGFCLDCHAEQENKDALYDCAVCHR